MPFVVFKDNLDEIKTEFKKEVEEKVSVDDEGIIIKADSLGSLEALMSLLRQENIKIVSAGIGNISKKDIISAQTNLKINPVNAVILGFNVDEDGDAKEMDDKKIKILKHEVIYKLIEELIKFQDEKRNEIKRERIMELATIGKLKILHQFVFRNSNPAIFGVAVEAGRIKPGIPLINEEGDEVSKIKGIQEQNHQLNEALQGKEIAISLPGVNFERQLQDKTYLYTDLSDKQFKKFKDNKDLLTSDEIQALQKIAEIKRKDNPGWGV